MSIGQGEFILWLRLLSALQQLSVCSSRPMTRDKTRDGVGKLDWGRPARISLPRKRVP